MPCLICRVVTSQWLPKLNLHKLFQPCHTRKVTVSTSCASASAAGGGSQFRRRREKSTVILVTIVALFVMCHSYRLALKVHEVADPEAHTMERFLHCFYKNK